MFTLPQVGLQVPTRVGALISYKSNKSLPRMLIVISEIKHTECVLYQLFQPVNKSCCSHVIVKYAKLLYVETSISVHHLAIFLN